MMGKLVVITLTLILGVSCSYATGKSFMAHMSALAEFIKSKSNPDVLPIKGLGQPITIFSGYGALNIGRVDEEHNFVEFEGIARRVWDSGITWSPADYDGIESITLPDKYFWTPILQQITSAVKNLEVQPPVLHIYCNGTITQHVMARDRVLCDVSNVDVGSPCNYKASFWAYSKDQLMMKPAAPVTAQYFPGSKYRIIGYSQNFEDYEHDGKVFQIFDSVVTIQRKPQARRQFGPFKTFFQWH